MKHFSRSSIVFLSLLLTILLISPAEVSSQTPTPARMLVAEYHPGEAVSYTFSQKMNLTTWFNPRAANAVKLSVTPHQYQVEGKVIATFAPTQPGEPLRATVQFQGLAVKNWVSSANVSDLEARLRELETAPLTLTTAADGDFELSGGPVVPIRDPYFSDVSSLENTARAALISRISNQPLAPGERRESADFPVHGIASAGIKLTTLTEYIADVPVARRPSAEVRLSLKVPDQRVPSPLMTSKGGEEAQVQMFFSTHADEVLTFLLDLEARQISFLHKTAREEIRVGAESTDTSQPVRIPVNFATMNVEVEGMVRRISASASGERETDLAAFEKSLEAPPKTALEAASPTAVGASGEPSLGDLARQLRAQRAAQPQTQTVITLSGGGAAREGAPAGFKEESLPNGDMTVFVPAAASEDERTTNVVHLHALLDKPRAIVMISFGEVRLGQIGSPDDALEATVKGLQAKGFRVGWSERESINGKPAVVFELQLEAEGRPFRELQANVISGGKGFVATCGTMAGDFPNVESICRAVVESIRVP